MLKELASQPDDGPARPTPYLVRPPPPLLRRFKRLSLAAQDMVIKETMRHALPSFGSLRDVTEDDVIEGGRAVRGLY